MYLDKKTSNKRSKVMLEFDQLPLVHVYSCLLSSHILIRYSRLANLVVFLGGPVPPLYVSFPGVGAWVRGCVGAW